MNGHPHRITTAPDSATDHALALAARGLSVIPVPIPDAEHDGKRPVIAWREYQSRRATETEIRKWFRRPQNIAVLTGATSGVVVVDLDTPAARQYWARHRPWTPWQVRTARGWHAYYRHPGGRVGNHARLPVAPGVTIDIRGDGGYVIGPGSLHASGKRYELAGDWTRPRESLPFYWPGWARRHEPTRATAPSPTPSSPRPTGDLLARARAYLAKIPLPEIGQGSDLETLKAAARIVRGFGLAEHEAVDVLWDWAGGRPGWTRDWVARKVRNAAKYGTEPVGGLA